MSVDSTQLQRDLLRDEGLRLSAYQDSEGYWTIGVGRLIDARRGGGISREEALYLLSHDLDRIEREVRTALPWVAGLDPVRQRVLLNMAFNLGVVGLRRFKNTLQAVRQGDYPRAAAQMLQSRWAEQVGARARRLAEQMRSGE
jgi:lysozyme